MHAKLLMRVLWASSLQLRLCLCRTEKRALGIYKVIPATVWKDKISHKKPTNLLLAAHESFSRSSRSAPEFQLFPSFGNFDHSVEVKCQLFTKLGIKSHLLARQITQCEKVSSSEALKRACVTVTMIVNA